MTVRELRRDYERLAKAVHRTAEGTAGRADAMEAKKAAFKLWYDANRAAERAAKAAPPPPTKDQRRAALRKTFAPAPAPAQAPAPAVPAPSPVTSPEAPQA